MKYYVLLLQGGEFADIRTVCASTIENNNKKKQGSTQAEHSSGKLGSINKANEGVKKDRYI